MFDLKNNIALLLIFFLLGQTLSAADGSSGMSFLKLDVDSRAAALGGAYSAMSNDAGAAFWNPAGLSNNNKRNLLVMHNIWIQDISQEFAALQFNSGQNHFALAVNFFNIPGIEIRDNRPSDQPLGLVSAINFSGGLSYARSLSAIWSVGITTKYLYEKYYLHSASGWAVDVGVLAKKLIPHLTVAAVIQNMGRMNKLAEKRTALPMLARLGFKYSVPFKLNGHIPALLGEIRSISGSGIQYRIGTELPIISHLPLRLGTQISPDEMRFTFGFGVNFQQYHFDYAFVPLGDYLGNSHRLTFGMYF